MLAGLIFVLLLVTTFFLLLFYKSQVPLLLVLPTELQELLYIILVTLATLCEVRAGEGEDVAQLVMQYKRYLKGGVGYHSLAASPYFLVAHKGVEDSLSPHANRKYGLAAGLDITLLCIKLQAATLLAVHPLCMLALNLLYTHPPLHPYIVHTCT